MFEDDKPTEDKPDDKPDDTEQDDSQEDDSVEQDDEDTSVGEDDDLAEEDDSEKDTPTFTNPKDLPDELKPTYKKMQASFTKKMQAISGERQKIEAFNLLMNDGEFRTWLEKRKQTLNKPNGRDESDDDDEADDKPITRKMLRSEMQKALNPHLKQQQDERLSRQAKIFKKRNPDWRQYYPLMNKIWERQPTLSFQMTYDAAVAIQNRRSGTKRKSEEEIIEDRRAANINKPNNHNARGGKERKGSINTVADAFEKAERMLGIKWRE